MIHGENLCNESLIIIIPFIYGKAPSSNKNAHSGAKYEKNGEIFLNGGSFVSIENLFTHLTIFFQFLAHCETISLQCLYILACITITVYFKKSYKRCILWKSFESNVKINWVWFFLNRNSLQQRYFAELKKKLIPEFSKHYCTHS